MKKILFLLLLLPLLGHAQDGVVTDTSYIENRAGTFWQVRTQTFESGSIVTRQDVIGTDTTAVVNALVGSVLSQFRQYANNVVAMQRGYARQRQSVNGVSTSLESLMGFTYFQAAAGLIEDQLLGTYTLRIAGGNPIEVQVVKLVSGAYRFRQGAANYPLDVFADNWLRVRNYPGAPVLLDLFYDPVSATYIDATGNLGVITYRLRKN